MIKLDRTRIPAPNSLTDSAGNGDLETKAAIAFFSRKNIPEGEKFSYSVYNSPTVKKAVSDLSFNKGAYCESKVLAIDDGDIEHFRPKGEITIENKTSLKPGYYWLGANWENLFLSCKHCNQARKQPLPDGTIKTLGKKNQFPLSNNKKRIQSHKRKIADEEPFRLLIDPCIDNPLDHIQFNEKGLISPKKLADNSNDKKGEASIFVFALLRKNLVEAREKEALKLMAALTTFASHVQEFNDDSPHLSAQRVAEKRKLLAEEVQRLKVHIKEDQPFSGMALQLLTSFLSNMGINL